ncbi:MAG: WbqC family protein [Bacteroidota bacterium]
MPTNQIISSTIILPSAYLPNLVYCAHLLNAEHIVIEQHQNYIKQTYSNRCHILGANGLQVLSIPVVKIHHTKQAINQVQINYEEDWQKQHWLAFQSAYGKSAFWFYYKDYFEAFYLEKKYSYLFEFNNELLKLILQLLKVNKAITYTQSFEPEYTEANDLRHYFDAKKRSQQENEEASQLKKYLQVFTEKYPFQSNLSIIDLLMNQGPQSKNYLLNE